MTVYNNMHLPRGIPLFLIQTFAQMVCINGKIVFTEVQTIA